MITKALRLQRHWSAPSQQEVLFLLLALTVCGLVLLPLGTLLIGSLKPDGALPFDSSALTVAHYVEVYFNPSTYRLLFNTLVYALSSLGLGLCIALVIAWLVERTDLPLSNLIYTGMFIPMATPGMITALGWVLLLNPQNGVVNLLLRQATGQSGRGPLDIYSLAGMILITGIAVVPTMFVMLAALMRNMDPNLEEAAQVSGAPASDVFRRVTAPLLAPGLLAVLIYFSIVLIEFFEIPLVIGMTAGERVLSTQIYIATKGENFQPARGLAATYALIGLVIGGGLILLYTRATRRAEQFAVVSGKGFRPRKVTLGPWRFVALAFIGLYLLLDVGLPFLILLWSSLLRFYEPPSVEALSHLSLERYAFVFVNDARVLGILRNTLLLMVGSATLCMLLSALVSWVVVRQRTRGARGLDILAFLPTAMPGMLIALALLLFSIGTPLYGTVAIIGLGHIIRYLPFGTRTMHAGVLQIQKELEDAGMTNGAGPMAVFQRIVAPLVAPALVNGWLWVAAHSMRDLTFPLLLVSADNVVVGTLLWEYWSAGKIAEASVVAIFLVLILVLLVFPLRLYSVRACVARAQP